MTFQSCAILCSLQFSIRAMPSLPFKLQIVMSTGQGGACGTLDTGRGHRPGPITRRFCVVRHALCLVSPRARGLGGTALTSIPPGACEVARTGTTAIWLHCRRPRAHSTSCFCLRVTFQMPITTSDCPWTPCALSFFQESKCAPFSWMQAGSFQSLVAIPLPRQGDGPR